ncbi:hypothetical protein L9G16_21260, partial [Shewanella sp. A25]|nr:hypothetical protein [Shewanella shenzhenensis]
RAMRLDQELACDAATLRRFPKARRLYAEALLKTELAHTPLPFGCRWPAAARHPLEVRLAALKGRARSGAAGGFAALAFTLAASGFMWA